MLDYNLKDVKPPIHAADPDGLAEFTFSSVASGVRSVCASAGRDGLPVCPSPARPASSFESGYSLSER